MTVNRRLYFTKLFLDFGMANLFEIHSNLNLLISKNMTMYLSIFSARMFAACMNITLIRFNFLSRGNVFGISDEQTGMCKYYVSALILYVNLNSTKKYPVFF